MRPIYEHPCLPEVERPLFIEWLVQSGCTLQKPNRARAIVHFSSEKGWGRITKTTGIKVSCSSEIATKAIFFYNAKRPFSFLRNPNTETKRDKIQRLSESIANTQGNLCFYCLKPFNPVNRRATLEHLVSKATGGPDTLSNCVRACGECNSKAGTMTVGQKFAMRENAKTERALNAIFGEPT